MPDTVIAEMTCVAKPTSSLIKRIQHHHGLHTMIDVAVAIESDTAHAALGTLMREAVGRSTSAIGTIDWPRAASIVLGKMKEHG